MEGESPTLISYEQLNMSLPYAQELAFKTFHVISSILTCLSHENTIETLLASKKYFLAKYSNADV